MVRVTASSLTWPAILSLIACGSAVAPLTARAQDSSEYRNEEQPRQDNQGFQNGDINTQNNPNADPNQNQDATQNASQGVVRLARFAYIKGNVTWRADASQEWAQATTNLPVRQDAQIWVTDGGRAELQFDDGSVLRLGNGALVTLKTLYSDQDGEFTQITMNEGLASLFARHDKGVYRVDTPLVSVTARGPAKVRFGIGDGVEVAVRQGQANIEGSQGKATLASGDYLDLRNADAPYEPRRVPREDNWDLWNAERDDQIEGAASRPAHQYLPPNIAIVANDLDDNGSWHDDAEYGHVWCPRVSGADWRPYHDGHWTWVNPFGWTWVSDEAWGWAPYHYGTWINRPYGWAWCPGPVNQYWCPAVVNFCEIDTRVAWCPLAPREVHYPAFLSIGFGRGNWSAFFSIGSAGVYYPGYNNYCVGRPFNTGYVNHVTYFNNGFGASVGFNRFSNSAEFFAANHNTYLQNRQYIPFNARNSAAVTVASREGFGTRTAYQALPRAGSTAIFTSGRVVSAPAGNAAPLGGPNAIRPTRASLTPLHTFAGNAAPPQRALARPVYQAPLPATIARRAVQVTPSGAAITPGRTVGNLSGTGASGLGSGRVFRPNNGSTATAPHPLQSSTTPGRGNSNGNGAGQNPRLPNGGLATGRPYTPETGRASSPSATTPGNTASARNGSTTPNERTIPRVSSGGNVNRGAAGAPSGAAQAAAQARASLGLPTNRTSAGGNSGAGRTYGGSSSGSSYTPRSSEGSRPTYLPGYSRSSGSGTETSRPTNDRSSGRTSDPRSYNPRTNESRSYDSRTYTPPTRSYGDSTPRTYNPPTRTATPSAPPSRTAPPSAPPARSESPGRSAPAPSHDRSSDSKGGDKKGR